MTLRLNLLYLAVGFPSDFQHHLIRHLAIFIEWLSHSVTKILTAVVQWDKRELCSPRCIQIQGKMRFRNGINVVMSHRKLSPTLLLSVPLTPLFSQKISYTQTPFQHIHPGLLYWHVFRVRYQVVRQSEVWHGLSDGCLISATAVSYRILVRQMDVWPPLCSLQTVTPAHWTHAFDGD